MTDAAPAGDAERGRRVQRLFEAALELDEAARAAFLGAQCGGDADLRAEVEALLASLEKVSTRDVMPSLLAHASTAASAMPPSRFTGVRVHNYQVDEQIGAGGMATVYAAHHLSFPRKAAFKVLQEQFSRNAEIVQRFLNEARAANAIRHPHIIEVIDAGRLEPTGAPYILMEYLEGESLGARLRAGPLPLATALRIAVETAEAVAAAHDKGIIHRDLKPENLFLVRHEGGTETVKVLDFGIAKLRADVASTLAHTQTGMFLGTPQYMSPEHCRNASGVDHRTDIYSLGVILYEMVCGRPPFRSDAGFGELIHLHLSADPEPPRKLVPDLPAAVDAAILRCLAKSPDDRFASMRELAAALRAVPTTDRNDRSQQAYLPTQAHRTLPARARSRRPVATVAVVLALIVVAGGVGVGLRLWRARSAASGGSTSAAAPAASPPAPREAAPAPVAAVVPASDKTIVKPIAAAIAPPATDRTAARARHRRHETSGSSDGAGAGEGAAPTAIAAPPPAARDQPERREKSAAPTEPGKSEARAPAPAGRKDIPDDLRTNPY